MTGGTQELAGADMPDAISDAIRMAIRQIWNSLVITSADPGYPVIYANPAFCRMTGYELHELVGRSLSMLQGPETDPEVIAHLSKSIREGRGFDGVAYNYRKTGERYLVHWTVTPVLNDAGAPQYYVSIQSDITDKPFGLNSFSALYKALHVIPEPIFTIDTDYTLTFANVAFTSLLRCRQRVNLRDLVVGDFAVAAQLLEQARTGNALATARGIVPFRGLDEEICYLDLTACRFDAGPAAEADIIVVAKDVTLHILQNRELSEAASTDLLTRLLNRRSGEALLQHAHVQVKTQGAQAALVMCDLDRFKDINDIHGHLVGDRAIQRVARVLRIESRREDAVVRWGGDEFMILLFDTDITAATEFAERMKVVIEEQVDPQYGRLTMSFGVAMLSPDRSLDETFAQVDSAMYAAKDQGRNRVVVV